MQWVNTTIEHLDFDPDIKCDARTCVHYGFQHTAHWWYRSACICQSVLPICDDEYRRMEEFFTRYVGTLYMTCKNCPWQGPVTMDDLILGPIR